MQLVFQINQYKNSNKIYKIKIKYFYNHYRIINLI